MKNLLRNLSLISKLSLSFGLIVLFSLVLNTLSSVELTSVEEANTEVAKIRESKDALQSAYDGIQKQHTSVLNLLVTADRAVLEQYQAGGAAYDSALNELNSTFRNDQELSPLLSQLNSAVVQWRSQYAEEQLRLARNYVTLNQGKAMEVSGEPAALFTTIDTIFNQMNVILNNRFENARKEATAALSSLNLMLISSLLASIIISLLAAWIMLKFVVKPINNMTSSMKILSNGNLDIDIPSLDAKDEIGDMARAVEVFKENAIERIRLTKEAEEQQQADKRREEEQRQKEEQQRQLESQQQAEALRRREEKEAKIIQLITDYDQASSSEFDRVSNVLEMLNGASAELKQASNLTRDRAENVSRAADDSNNNVQSVASASEQVDNSVHEIASQIARSSEKTTEASKKVSDTKTQMSSLEEATTAIGNVMKLISDIAEQTNLLALNATIEAARAGEAGRGFAIVAGEVKSLANETAKATDEIRAQVNAVQQQTKSVAEAMTEIEQVTNEVTEMASAIAAAVEEQKAATNEISRSISHAASNTREVSENIATVAEAAEANNEIATKVSSSSGDIANSSEHIKQFTQNFIETIRAEALAE